MSSSLSWPFDGTRWQSRRVTNRHPYFFFLIGKEKLYWKIKKERYSKNSFPATQGVYKRKEKSIQNYINLENLSKEGMGKPLKAVIYSNKYKMKMRFNSMIECSSPSEVRLFCSLHIVHIIHCGIEPQKEAALCCPTPLCQQASNSTTRLGITQDIPKYQTSWAQMTTGCRHKNNEGVGDPPIPHHSCICNTC